MKITKNKGSELPEPLFFFIEVTGLEPAASTSLKIPETFYIFPYHF
jgi:hypothetical protein